MHNVVNLQDAPGFRRSESRHSLHDCETDIVGLSDRVRDLQYKAKVELREAIFLLDVAAQHAHQIAKAARAPALKRHFYREISVIEELLQLARNQALKL
jgi:hypothetical protein